MIHEMAMERVDYHYHEGWQTESVDFQGLLGMFDWDRECRSNNRLLLRFLVPLMLPTFRWRQFRDRFRAGLSHLHASAASVHSLAHEFETKCHLVWMLRRLQDFPHHFCPIVGGVSRLKHVWMINYPLVISHSYWTWWFIVSFPIKNGGSFQ